MGVSPDDMIIIPVRTSEQFFGSSGQYNMIMASVYDLDDIDKVTEHIKDGIENVQIVSAQSAKDMIADVTGTIESVLGGIAAISLLVAGVGIINTMTVSVNERTKEIGTMKAIGAKNIDILLIFLSESGYTGIAGGFLGGAPRVPPRNNDRKLYWAPSLHEHQPLDNGSLIRSIYLRYCRCLARLEGS